MKPALLALAAAGVFGPSSLGAQTLALPEISEPLPAITGPDAGDATLHRGRDAWEASFGAGFGWDSNVDFVPGGGTEDAVVVPRASLGRVFRSRRGQLRATATGAWTGYRERDDLRRLYGDLSLEGSHASERARWEGMVSFGIGDSTSSRILREQGVALPRVATRSLIGSLGLSRDLGRRAVLRLEGRFQGTDFEASELDDGASARFRMGVDRDLGPRASLGAGYAAEQVFSRRGAGPSLTHFGSAQWTQGLARRAAVLLEGGVSYTPDFSRAGLARSTNFFGGASLTAGGPRSRLTVFVRREVAPAFGTGGSRLDLRTGLRGALALGRAWEAEIEGAHVLPQAGAVDAFGPTYDGFAGVGRQLGRFFAIRGETRYRRRGATAGQPGVDELQAGLHVSVHNGPRDPGGVAR